MLYNVFKEINRNNGVTKLIPVRSEEWEVHVAYLKF